MNAHETYFAAMLLALSFSGCLITVLRSSKLHFTILVASVDWAGAVNINLPDAALLKTQRSGTRALLLQKQGHCI
jgi:hypothetical protein